MANNIVPSAPHKNFEQIKKIDENGIEYWIARELMILLNYSQWRNFDEVIKKAQRACLESGENIENHFADISKMVEIGSNTVRKIDDYKLDRYACYLIAQNGDSSKPEIALAQTYFTIQTRKQEIFEQLPDAAKRLFIRDEVSDHNKKLFRTAKKAGVKTKLSFGLFNDAGYQGLYGLPLSEIEQKKKIKKGELLDRAGATELAANLFRITQTDAKLKKDNVKNENTATITHRIVGQKIRQTIEEIGGELPENLPSEKHIKEVRRELKQLGRNGVKKLKSGK